VTSNINNHLQLTEMQAAGIIFKKLNHHQQEEKFAWETLLIDKKKRELHSDELCSLLARFYG